MNFKEHHSLKMLRFFNLEFENQPEKEVKKCDEIG